MMMAKEQAEAARAGDKEAQQKRVYYQSALETDSFSSCRRMGYRPRHATPATLGPACTPDAAGRET